MRKLFRRKSRYAGVIFAVAVAVALMPLTAQATLIIFDGFVENAPVGAVGIATFGVGPAAVPTGPGFIVAVGAPPTAFVPNDTPNPTTNAGTHFLTDGTTATAVGLALNYFIEFSVPVTSLSLDLYDYLVEDGPPSGSTATLTAYSDVIGGIVVGSPDVFAVSSGLPDGNVVPLSVSAPSIRAASLLFSSGDPGTGIDNINFTPVPEPSTFLLLGVGLAGAGLVSRRRLRVKNGY